MRRWLRRLDGPLTADLARISTPAGQLPARLAPEATATVVCGYCSTGCGLDVHLQGGRAVNLTPARDHPVNRGSACPKGWEALVPLASPARATRPLLRGARGRLEPVSWERALDLFVTRFRGIAARHGAAANAFLSTGQITCEEMAFLGALCKFGMGMRHGDGNTRQCMATAVAAYKESFGFDAPPYCYDDLEESDVLVLWGANPCIAHPILWERVCRNRHAPAILVVDPRRTETAMAATAHLALRPKSDLHLAYGLAHLLIEGDLLDRRFIAAHTSEFDAFAAHVAAFTPARVAAATGLGEVQLRAAAEKIGRGQRVSFWWTMGINQSHEGVRAAQAIINLALMTGNIGRPGTGANSITGQCNAMGSRLFSNTTSLLGGHDFADPAHRARVSEILGIPAAVIPEDAGWAYDQILEGIHEGAIRGLWIVATNTAHSWINQSDVRELLGRLDFLVVQDLYADGETARMADLVLPAAGWGEKEGTFINSERRIGRVKRVAASPGQALADLAIFRLVAEAWGCADMFRAFTSPERVFQLLKQLTAGRPCDIGGIADYAALDRAGGIQWPLPARAAGAPLAASRRLFGDGRFYTASGRARFCFAEPRPLPESPGNRYPFLLLTGRGSSAQWHTGTRTDRSPVLRALAPAHAYVEINPRDARMLAIRPGEMVEVSSRRGSAQVRAFVTSHVQPGQLFMPMHYEVTNRLTFPAFDPHSRQPAYKACAVAIRRLEPWERAG